MKQEVSNAEEETAIDIDEGRQAPDRPLAVTAEIDMAIDEARANIIGFLETDFDEEEYTEAMSNYFGRIGHLIGLNPPKQNELAEIAAEEAAQEEANLSLDGSGLLAEENEEDDENIEPI